MSFTFNPMTEDQIRSINLVEPGTYDFIVIRAIEKISKSGNQMIELQLKFWDKNGMTHLIFDYLVSLPSMMYKVKHFCDAVGLTKEYEEGKFEIHSCESRTGQLDLTIQEAKPNPKGGTFSPKNAVKDYIKSDIKNVPDDKFTDNEVPF